MVYLLLALFVYVCFALKNNKIIKTTVGNEIIIPAEEKKQNISWLAVIVLILFSGLRAHTIGQDLPTYRRCFNEIGNAKSINNGFEHYEPFYRVLNWICSLFGPTDLAFSIFLLVISIINVLVVVLLAKSLSSDISMTMFLYVCIDVYISSFSLLRQTLAIVFIILSFKYIYEKKLLNFITCVLVAHFFHDSALLLLVLYLLNILKTDKHHYYYYGLGLLLIIVFSFFDEQIIMRICNILDFNYYWFYKMEGSDMTLFSYLKGIAIILSFCVFFAYKVQRDKQNKPLDSKYNLFLNIYYISALMNLYNIITGTLGIVSRITYYFTCVLILLVPEFLNSIKDKKWNKIFTAVMIVVGLCYLSTAVLLRDQYWIVPYKTVFGM